MRVLALVFLLASVADAQVSVLQAKYRECRAGSCSVICSYGTAVNIGERPDRPGHYVFATAFHNVEDVFAAEPSSRGIWINDGRGYVPAEFLCKSAKADLALLSIPSRDPAVWRVIGLPSDVRDVESYGFPGTQRAIRRLSYSNVRAAVPGEPNFIADFTQHGGPSRGDSGGPVVLAGTRMVIGILWGNDGGHMWFVGGDEIVRVYNRCFAGWGESAGGEGSEGLVPIPQKPVPQPREPDPVTQPHSHPALAERVKQLEADNRTLTLKMNALQAGLDTATVPVELIDPDGKVVSREEYPLGTPLRFRVSRPKD